MIFGCKIKGYERVIGPIEQSRCKPIVLSKRKTFEVIFRKVIAICYGLISPIFESPQVTLLKGGFWGRSFGRKEEFGPARLWQ